MRFHVRSRIRLALAAVAFAAASSAQAYSQIVAFGDSLSDNGNLHALMAQFNVDTPASPYFEGRFSNGPVAVEVMALPGGRARGARAPGAAPTGTGNKTAPPTLDATGMPAQVNKYLGEK